MPIVSGFVVPKMNPTSHVGNIRLLRPVVLAIEYQVDNQTKNAEPNGKKEPNEILHVVSEVGSIIFLIPVPNLFALVCKHFIDLTDMFLHLSSHPLTFLAE